MQDVMCRMLYHGSRCCGLAVKVSFSQERGEGYMDKISVILISGIVALVLTSAIIIYDTWASDDISTISAETLTEESQDEELIFGDDTSVRNNSLKKLWIRAKPVFDENSDPDAYTIISAAVDCGKWSIGAENWYYYERPIEFAQETEPLVDRLLYNGEEISAGRGGFRIKVEAVDEEWFVAKPDSGSEAFEFFEESMAIPDGELL